MNGSQSYLCSSHFIKAMKTAADLILECKSWESKLGNSETPGSLVKTISQTTTQLPIYPKNQRLRPKDLITALVRDMSSHLDGLQSTRALVEAWIYIFSADHYVFISDYN